jgi:hypothetical protein
MSSFVQQFLHGTKTINGVAWKLAERSEAAMCATTYSTQEKVVIEQEYADPPKNPPSGDAYIEKMND